MSDALDKLTFTVLLLDKLSQPSKAVCKSMQAMQSESRDGMLMIGKGSAGVLAAGSALGAFTDPARDFTKALGEVSSLDVQAEELEALGGASKKFAARFGGDAAAIARSAYDIQSAIPGLGKGALAAFTYSGALLAKAGKADAATITKYQGTMYNIFERDAKRIGQAEWVDQLTGKTAYAVKMFKTTGAEMAAAFTNLGSTGQVYGRSMDEQMAVLGTLQGSMGSGANAGTAYKAFLNNIGKAETSLGMSFSDSQGRMLGVAEILDKIRAKVGEGDITTANATKIMQAFGEEGGKAVLNLLNKTGDLKKSIGAIADIKDASGALKMADAMNDPLARFESSLKVIKITLGQAMLPVINRIFDMLSGGLSVLQWLLETLPPLRWLIAAVALAMTALGIAWGTFMIIAGSAKMLRATYMELRIVWAWCLKNSAATHSMTAAQKINAVATMLWGKTLAFSRGVLQFFTWSNLKNIAVTLWSITVTAASTLALLAQRGALLAGVAAMAIYKGAGLLLAGATALLSGGLWAVTAAAWGFTVALLANPITWIILGIVALGAGLVALVVYWDDVCAWLAKAWEWFTTLLMPVTKLLDSIQAISAAWDWLTGKGPADLTVNRSDASTTVSDVTAARRPSRDIPAGGIAGGNSNTVNYGGITIHTSAPAGPGMLEDLFLLNGGI